MNVQDTVICGEWEATFQSINLVDWVFSWFGNTNSLTSSEELISFSHAQSKLKQRQSLFFSEMTNGLYIPGGKDDTKGQWHSYFNG